MLRRYGIFILVALLFAATYLPYRSLTAAHARKGDPNILFLPKADSLRTVKFGLEGVLSDVLWLRAIGYVSAQLDVTGPGRFRQLQPLYETITDLDPYFISAYRYGAIFLSVFTRNHDAAIALLKKGLAIPENRSRWELYYDLGATYFLEKKDFQRAAEYFKLAAKDDDAPAFVPHVATYFLRHTQKEHGTALALSLWQRRLESKNEEVRRIARQEIAQITRDHDKEILERAVALFRQLTGRFPASLDELMRPGVLAGAPEERAVELFARTVGRPPKDRAEILSLSVLKKLPQEPTGGSYRLDPATGKITPEDGPLAKELFEDAAGGRRR